MERHELAGSRGAMELRVALPDPAGARLVLELPAVAGCCRVRLDGVELAVLGPSWTSLRLPLDGARAGAPLELTVEPVPPAADPFAGFLPEVQAAPRGLWQGAFLRTTGPACFLGPPRVVWRGDDVQLEAEWDGPDDAELAVTGEDMPRWSPAAPRCGRLRVALVMAGAESDVETRPAAARRLYAGGERLLLNGESFRARGLLHWGLYPGLPGPDPEAAAVCAELLSMRARGFNLLKCCLWLPPERFLDACDAAGMPVWLEYPLWNRPLGPELLDGYRALLAQDAGHPCVVLRTLTCENDQRDATAARAIAELVRAHDPHALLADNSAWLGHTHVADFHDEHPYLHGAQWPFYLERLRAALDARRPPRPLLLGETMVADATADPAARRLAMASRRFQAESFARAFPDAGYVICGARDAPNAPLGVQDAAGHWLDSEEAWAWQRALAAPPPAGGYAVHEPAPPPAPPPLPEGVLVVDRLDAAVRAALRDGASVLHLAGPNRGSWRTPEWLFWSCAPVLAGPAAAEPLRELLLTHLPFGLLSGRRLARCAEAALLVGFEDLHDARAARGPAPLVLAARVGRGRLLVSALRADSAAGAAVHAALARAVLAPDAPELPPLELPAPAPSFFLDGPWELDGRRFRTGTMLANAGANATWGARVVRGRLGPTGLPPGPAILRAEAVADGWELWADGALLHRHGNPGRSWDAGRDVPAELPFPAALLARAESGGVALEWRVHDHRGAGVMIGPIWLRPAAASLAPLA